MARLLGSALELKGLIGSPVWTRFELSQLSWPLIEPVDGDCFQRDACDPLAGVHAGRPGWTRLELAWGEQDNFRVARLTGRNW
jgi:hypothetical protein